MPPILTGGAWGWREYLAKSLEPSLHQGVKISALYIAEQPRGMDWASIAIQGSGGTGK